MVGLAALDGPTTGSRRFGGDADAHWKAFQGGLKDWHRIDLLVRDADVRFPAAFAPRVVFALPAPAADEPYGPDWPGATPIEAADLLRAGGTTPGDLQTALSAVAAA